ncbi:MAG: hypothetical protein LBR24_03720, partial [Methanobrevibacter sp.]|nr:hypothetical protein [Methanobrevibacter sp.]
MLKNYDFDFGMDKMNYNELLVLFLITFVVTVLFTFFIRKILLNAGIADNPIVSEHRHKKGTPTMGGIAFLFAILFVLAIFFHNGLVFITAFMMVVAAIAGWID